MTFEVSRMGSIPILINDINYNTMSYNINISYTPKSQQPAIYNTYNHFYCINNSVFIFCNTIIMICFPGFPNLRGGDACNIRIFHGHFAQPTTNIKKKNHKNNTVNSFSYKIIPNLCKQIHPTNTIKITPINKTIYITQHIHTNYNYTNSTNHHSYRC